MLKLRAPLQNDSYGRLRPKYKIDLPLQLAECEANYLRLTKILMNMSGDTRELAVSHGKRQWFYKIQVIERSPYTTTLQLSQTTNQPSPYAVWLQMPRLTVRMYHDAKLAEVLAWEGHKRLRPRYDYPNQSMYQSDEKLQINQFLRDWLALCLLEGHEVAH